LASYVTRTRRVCERRVVRRIFDVRGRYE